MPLVPSSPYLCALALEILESLMTPRRWIVNAHPVLLQVAAYYDIYQHVLQQEISPPLSLLLVLVSSKGDPPILSFDG